MPSLTVALRVLQALALQFHVGSLAPEDRWSREDVIRIAGGDDEDAAEKMRHWFIMSEYVFSGPVRELLLTGQDPIRAGSRDSWREGGQALLTEVQSALASDEEQLFSSDANRLEVAVDAWAHRDPSGFEQWSGTSVADYEASARARAPMRRAAAAASAGAKAEDEPPPAKRWVTPLASLDPQSEAAVHIGANAGAFHGTFSNSGPSSLSRSDNYVEYLSQLIDFWRVASERLFAADSREGLDGIVEMRFPMAIRHLEHLDRVPRFANRIQYGSADRRGEVTPWSLGRRTYLDLIEQLGAMVIDAVARRLRSPPYAPGLLWIGGDDELRAARFRLDRVDVRIEQASSHGEAIEGMREGHVPDSSRGIPYSDINVVVFADAAEIGAQAAISAAEQLVDETAHITSQLREKKAITIALLAPRPGTFDSLLPTDSEIRVATDGDDVLFVLLENVLARLR